MMKWSIAQLRKTEELTKIPKKPKTNLPIKPKTAGTKVSTPDSSATEQKIVSNKQAKKVQGEIDIIRYLLFFSFKDEKIPNKKETNDLNIFTFSKLIL